MKQLFLILILFVFFENAFSAERVWVQKKVREQVEDIIEIECTSNTNCYSVGNSAYFIRLYQSTDAGNSWEVAFEHKPDWINGVMNVGLDFQAIDSLTLYLTEQTKVAVHFSLDGGRTFNTKTFGELSTNDWDNFNNIAMYGDNGVGTISNYVIYTRDNWNTFKAVDRPKFNEDYKRPGEPLFFIDSSNVAMLRWSNRSHDFVKFNLDTEEWIKYSDSIYPDSDRPKSIIDIEWINDSLAFGCGYQAVSENSNAAYSLIWKTTNKGRKWELIYNHYREGDVSLKDISFSRDGQYGIALGSFGVAMETRDFGESWDYIDLPDEINHSIGISIEYAGSTPLIGCWNAGIWRLESFTGIDNYIFDSEKIKVRQLDDKLMISIEDESFSKYTVQIVDLQGNEVYNEQVDSGIGTYFKPYNISNLFSGVYFYRIYNSLGNTTDGSFVILK